MAKILLVHGFTNKGRGTMDDLASVLRSQGHEVTLVEYDSNLSRRNMRRQVEMQIKNSHYDVMIGHSMGGYLVNDIADSVQFHKPRTISINSPGETRGYNYQNMGDYMFVGRALVGDVSLSEIISTEHYDWETNFGWDSPWNQHSMDSVNLDHIAKVVGHRIGINSYVSYSQNEYWKYTGN